MKQLLLIIAIILSYNLTVSAQTKVEHGIGLSVGLAGKGNVSASGEYQISLLKNANDYTKGLIIGMGASRPFDKNYSREFAGYGIFGYRILGLSFGVRAGYKDGEMDTPKFDYESNKINSSKFLGGGWIGYNITKGTRLHAGGDNFNGFTVGLVFRLNAN